MHTAQKMKFSVTDFFSKCDQIRKKLCIWSHLLKKSLMGSSGSNKILTMPLLPFKTKHSEFRNRSSRQLSVVENFFQVQSGNMRKNADIFNELILNFNEFTFLG